MGLERFFRDARIALAFTYVVLIGRSIGGEAKLEGKVAYKNHTVLTSGLYWNNLNVRTADGTYLLHDFCGYVENGHVCGILGPSGAGKSTILSALGGTISSSSRSQVNGEVFYYDDDIQRKESLRVQGGRVAWMKQEEFFFRNAFGTRDTRISCIPRVARAFRAAKTRTSDVNHGITGSSQAEE